MSKRRLNRRDREGVQKSWSVTRTPEAGVPLGVSSRP
jgi:hypothetical protein